MPMPATLRKASTDNCIIGLEELAANSSAMGLEETEYRQLIRKVTAEIEAGVYLHYDMIVWVGRKATESEESGREDEK